ncbi:MAG: hypothetical protein AABX05_00855 [Nanoarchaeota archaeon]
MVKKRAVKKAGKRVSARKGSYKGRGPSGKPKHSKVAKMIKLAKARSRKTINVKKAASKSKKKRR